MRTIRLTLLTGLFCVLLLVLASPALAITYVAGYEADNQWHNPFSEWGDFGARATIFTPSVYPTYHAGTMKATVQARWPNQANEWVLRTGWKSDVAQQEAYGYYEGYTSAHSYVQVTYATTQARGAGRAYQIKQSTGGSNLYNVTIAGLFRAQLCLSTNSYVACSGHARCSGGDNDFRAKYIGAQVWKAYGYWDDIGRSNYDYALSPIYGGGIYYEAPISGDEDDFTIWNWYYGYYY